MLDARVHFLGEEIAQSSEHRAAVTNHRPAERADIDRALIEAGGRFGIAPSKALAMSAGRVGRSSTIILPMCFPSRSYGKILGSKSARSACFSWSERRDLNSRPPVPQTGALTGLRYAPS